VLNDQPTQARVDSVLARQQVLNMVNTKYLILNPSSPPLQNKSAMGHGWLVTRYQLVENADQEFLALETTDLTQTAVVDQRFSDLLSEDLNHQEVQGRVELTNYQPNKLVYQVQAEQRSLAVFSEVYYGDHWKATIDGEPVDHLRANYLLRALPVDAGEHTVVFEFVFEPYEKGRKVSMAGSVLVLLILAGSLGYSAYARLNREEDLS